MEKVKILEDILRKYEKICVAYSGGTDSDFLLNVSKQVLKDNVIAIIGRGVMLAQKDFDEAVRLAEKAKVKYYIIEADVLQTKEFKYNDKERCYYCKKTIMNGLKEKALQLGFENIADGKNCDDGKVYRPGVAAAKEIGIISPLYEAGFTKAEIRQAAKEMCLETWDKPSNSCLATRFPYDTELTIENFLKVEKAEKLIADFGIPSGRVRLHGDIARIEIPKDRFTAFMENIELSKNIKSIGFKYITLDLEGFRSGSMD